MYLKYPPFLLLQKWLDFWCDQNYLLFIPSFSIFWSFENHDISLEIFLERFCKFSKRNTPQFQILVAQWKVSRCCTYMYICALMCIMCTYVLRTATQDWKIVHATPFFSWGLLGDWFLLAVAAFLLFSWVAIYHPLLKSWPRNLGSIIVQENTALQTTQCILRVNSTTYRNW